MQYQLHTVASSNADNVSVSPNVCMFNFFPVLGLFISDTGISWKHLWYWWRIGIHLSEEALLNHNSQLQSLHWKYELKNNWKMPWVLYFITKYFCITALWQSNSAFIYLYFNSFSMTAVFWYSALDLYTALGDYCLLAFLILHWNLFLKFSKFVFNYFCYFSKHTCINVTNYILYKFGMIELGV